jgi:hypothetical protein
MMIHTALTKFYAVHFMFNGNQVLPHRRYSSFDVVEGFVWSRDPDIYAEGNTPIGRASHLGQDKGDDPD